MIDGQFLRKIELNPSPDLFARTDLLHLQINSELVPQDWLSLVKPATTIERQEFLTYFNAFVDRYKLEIDSTPSKEIVFNAQLPTHCVNPTVYNLCLVNRIRYQLGYPLLTFQETDWIEFATYYYDPLFKHKFNLYLQERMYNG